MLTTLFLHMSQPDNGSNLAPCLCNNLTDKGNMKITFQSRLICSYACGYNKNLVKDCVSIKSRTRYTLILHIRMERNHNDVLNCHTSRHCIHSDTGLLFFCLDKLHCICQNEFLVSQNFRSLQIRT